MIDTAKAQWAGTLLAAGLIGGTFIPAAGPAFAADLNPPMAPAPFAEPMLPSTWHFEASLDGEAPNLNVAMGIRTFPVVVASANFFQLLQHLEAYVPATVIAYNDNFIVGLNFLWVRLGIDGHFAPDGGAFGGLNAGLTINELAATGYGGVRIPTEASDWRVNQLPGATYFNINGSLTLGVPILDASRPLRMASPGPIRSSA